MTAIAGVTVTGGLVSVVTVGTQGPSGGGGSADFVENSTPAGVIDGANAEFELESEPATPDALQLYRNGLLQTPGTDYSLAGTTITYVAAPAAGDTHVAFYRV